MLFSVLSNSLTSRMFFLIFFLIKRLNLFIEKIKRAKNKLKIKNLIHSIRIQLGKKIENLYNKYNRFFIFNFSGRINQFCILLNSLLIFRLILILLLHEKLFFCCRFMVFYLLTSLL